MNKLNIRQGTKMTIRPESEISNNDFILRASFEKATDDDRFLISAPLRDGKTFVFAPDDKLSISYESLDTMYAVEGYAEDVVRIGERSYVRIRTVSSSRRFIQRVDVRFKASTDVKLVKSSYGMYRSSAQEAYLGRTIDISNGGVAVCSNISLVTGDILLVTLIPPSASKKPFDVRAEVCWVREAPRGSTYRRIFGVKFLFENRDEQLKAADFITETVNAVG